MNERKEGDKHGIMKTVLTSTVNLGLKISMKTN